MKKICTASLAILFFAIVCFSVFSIFAIEDDREQSEGNIVPTAKDFVFLSDNGNDANSGKSFDEAVKTLYRASELLDENGGVIVICEKLTVDSSSFVLSTDKDIEFTSYYEGTDYKADKGAEIYFDDILNLKSNGKITFYGVRFHSQNTPQIYCNGTNVEFGARIENLSDDGKYPSVFGGRLLNGSNTTEDGNFSDFTVSVSNGYWNSITLGNNRVGTAAPMSTIKNATLEIKGGSFVARDGDESLTSAVSGAYVSGKINLDISGGIFYGSVFVIGNEGDILPFIDLRYEADVSFKITNGTFSGKYIKALYSKKATLGGKYDFIAEGGSFSALTYVGCEGVKSTITLSSCESIQNKLYGFEKVIFVSTDGNDDNSGENPTTAKKTLAGAFAALRSGGSIVICSDFSIGDGYATRITGQKIRITSKYYDTDYAQTNGAKLNLSGNISLRSDISFDNITLNSDSTAALSSYAGLFELGENVTINGDMAVILEQTAGSHTFAMASGNVASFEFKNSSISTFVSISGGVIESFSGCTEHHTGDIFVDFSGGTVNGDISIAPNGIGGNLQLIVGNAQIQGGISTQRPGEDKLCEALVVYNYDRAKLSGFDIIEDKYVFVKDGASGNGSTPTLAAPTIEDALLYIGNSNACVVFCGKTTHRADYLPKGTGIVTYSSIYRNIDFSSINGAMLVLEKDYYFDNDATLQNLKISSIKKDVSFHCNSHIVIFGYGLICEIPFANTDYYPSIIGCDGIPSNPYNDKGESLSDKVIIQSGTWKNVYSSAATEISGGRIYGSVFGTKNLSNNCCITVSGGIIYGGIYASEHASENSASHITFTFNAGEIHGVISPSYRKSSGYSGRFIINVSGGDFTGVDKIENASVIGGTNSYANIRDDIDLTAYADSFIAYQNPVSNTVSDVSYVDGVWYLAESNGTLIELYTSNSITSLGSSLPVYSYDLNNTVTELSLSICDGKMYIFARTYAENGFEMNVFLSDSLDAGAVSFTKLEGNDVKRYVCPSVVAHNGEKYLYFALENDNGADIYCAKVDAALNLLSDVVLVLSADSKWENGYVTSPRIIVSPDGKLYICYTGGDVNGGSSMIGIASIISSNLLSADSYKKSPDPVFYETEKFKNITLSSIVDIKEAGEPYFVYSTRIDGEYALIMQSFSYDSVGVPYFSTPCDINTLYLSYYMPRTLTTLLEGFEVNITSNVPNNSIIQKDFSLIKFLKDNLLIVISCFTLIMAVLVIMIIRKFSQSPKSQLKDKSKKRSSNDRRRASRLNVGREYAAKLQILEAEAKKNEEQAEEPNADNENDSDLDEITSQSADTFDGEDNAAEQDAEVEKSDVDVENETKLCDNSIPESVQSIEETADEVDGCINSPTDEAEESTMTEQILSELAEVTSALDSAEIKQEKGLLDTPQKKKRPRAKKEI